MIWQTVSGLSLGDDVPAYAVSPPAGLAEGREPTIVDARGLAEPLIPDADAEALLEVASTDFPLIGSLRPDVEQLTERLGSRSIAERLVSQLAPAAQALAGAQAGEPSLEISAFDGTDATVAVIATYFPPDAQPTALGIDLVYTRADEGWALASAGVTSGIGS